MSHQLMFCLVQLIITDGSLSSEFSLNLFIFHCDWLWVRNDPQNGTGPRTGVFGPMSFPLRTRKVGPPLVVFLIFSPSLSARKWAEVKWTTQSPLPTVDTTPAELDQIN